MGGYCATKNSLAARVAIVGGAMGVEVPVVHNGLWLGKAVDWCYTGEMEWWGQAMCQAFAWDLELGIVYTRS